MSKDKKILIVEDDPTARLIAEKLLGAYFQVTSTSNSAEALALCGNEVFDAVFMDIDLGEDSINGVELMKQIKMLSNQKGIKITAVTSHKEPEDEARFLQEGFDNYFAKPYSRERLVAAFEKQID